MTWRRALVALGVPAMACSSPSPTATRSRHETSATPRADAGSDATVAPAVTTSTEPAPSSTVAGTQPPATVGPNTTVTFTVPTTPRTTTTFAVLQPERADEDLSDDDWAGRERILACIRSYEGGYGTETGNGHHGAYQFVQSTWDGAVARAGYPQWVGRRAGDAPAHVQDDAAWQLYLEQGFGPWPPASRYCRGVA